jgi:hypothetical protein
MRTCRSAARIALGILARVKTQANCRILFAACLALLGCIASPVFAQQPNTQPAQNAAQGAVPNPITSAPTGPLLLSVEGNGIQVYRCSVVAGEAVWVVDHPDAELHTNDGQAVGKHFAGPTWQYKDGSEVVGLVVTHSPGKEHGDAPWLRLQAIKHKGHGLLSQVETIERTDTEGGGAPPIGCDAATAGRMQIVPYKARYTFYGKQ